MNDIDARCESISSIARRMQDLQRQGAQQYKPILDDIVNSRSRDAKQIEYALDGLIDFCGYGPALEMYKQLCRHYWDIDPAATAFYVNAYRQYWDSEDERGTP